MSKKVLKKYIDSDVYTEAKKRVKHIISVFDTVLVAFSGGKDSLAALNVVEEVYNELGIKEKIKVFFRDEELIPDDVVEFVQNMAESGKYDFRYYAIPLKSTKFILGDSREYVQWDKDRQWLRQPPSYAIRLKEDEYQVFDQYTADEYICQNEKGRVAIITGIRADESLVRLRSCVVKKNENYINSTSSPRIKLCKPLYDWTEKDIFIYFCKNDIKYCGIYDQQLINGQALRVSTPLHAESAKQFNKIRTIYPKYYQGLVDLFPEMLVQERYWSEYDRNGVIDKYPHSWAGIIKYIKENIPDKSQQAKAIDVVRKCKTIRENKLAKGEGLHNMGGYGIKYVFKCIIAGQYKRMLQPNATPNRGDFEYEGLPYPDDKKN